MIAPCFQVSSGFVGSAIARILSRPAVFEDEREARIEPFEAIVLDVASWWA
jgi:hypothetical protein